MKIIIFSIFFLISLFKAYINRKILEVEVKMEEDIVVR